MRWVKLHPTTSARRCRWWSSTTATTCSRCSNGQGEKAMVVVEQPAGGGALATGRRQVHQGDQGYKIGTLVAFSGEVNRPGGLGRPFRNQRDC